MLKFNLYFWIPANDNKFLYSSLEITICFNEVFNYLESSEVHVFNV